MTMEGQEVFKFAVKQVPECIKEVLEETGNTAEDIDQFIIHQANYRIIESIAKRLKESAKSGSGEIPGEHGTLWKYIRRVRTYFTGRVKQSRKA